jgi:type IV pilus assembly protein PilV
MSMNVSFRQRGLSMIEILVTLTIVAFGLLGLMGLQARALNFQKDSFDRKAVAELVNQLGERMRANYLGFQAGLYTLNLHHSTATPGAIGTCGNPDRCTRAEVVTRDLDQWAVELRRRLPGSAAYIAFDPLNTQWATVTLAWPEPQADEATGPLSTGADAVCGAVRLGVDPSLPTNFRCYSTMVFP